MNFHKKILIGVLFQFLDINIGPVDIIPDFVGFLIIMSAFAKRTARYAILGVATSLILSVASLVEIFYPELQQATSSLPLQLVGILIGAVTVIYYGCIFSVSKDVMDGEKSSFPIVFISAQLLAQVFGSVGMYVVTDRFEGVMVIVMLVLMCLYVYFIVFLWQRKNKEQAQMDEESKSVAWSD